VTGAIKEKGYSQFCASLRDPVSNSRAGEGRRSAPMSAMLLFDYTSPVRVDGPFMRANDLDPLAVGEFTSDPGPGGVSLPVHETRSWITFLCFGIFGEHSRAYPPAHL
jgi:hypothetical protein